MQKIILDTIEEFREKWHTEELSDVQGLEQTNKWVLDFFKQALTNAFEAGQKSREMEIESRYFDQTEGVVGGKLKFRGTRIIADFVIEYLEKGWSWEEVKKLFPPIKTSLSLTKESDAK